MFVSIWPLQTRRAHRGGIPASKPGGPLQRQIEKETSYAISQYL